MNEPVPLEESTAKPCGCARLWVCPELAPASLYYGLIYDVIEMHEFCKAHPEPALPLGLRKVQEEISGSTARTLSQESTVQGPANLNHLCILRVSGLGSILLSIYIRGWLWFIGQILC